MNHNVYLNLRTLHRRHHLLITLQSAKDYISTAILIINLINKLIISLAFVKRLRNVNYKLDIIISFVNNYNFDFDFKILIFLFKRLYLDFNNSNKRK